MTVVLEARGGKCRAAAGLGQDLISADTSLANCSALPQLLSEISNPSSEPQGFRALQVALPVHGQAVGVCLQTGTGLIPIHFIIHKHVFFIRVI